MKETEREEYRSMIGSLMRAINVHPDCTDGSEFDDYAQAADDLLFKYQKLLPDVDETPTPESWWPTEGEIEQEAILLYPTVDEEKNPNVNRIIGFERAAFKAAIQWLQTSAGTREAELREAMEEITSLNPYPESVFQPISNGELKAVGGMLKNINGMSLDRLSGHIGRLLLKGIQTRAKSLLNKTDL